MSFLNKMKKAGEALADKAKDLTDTTGLKFEKAQLKGDIEDIYVAIGKKVVEANDERFATEIAQIKEKEARMAQIDEEIGDIQGKVKCPECGTMVLEDDRFCPKCGHEMK